MKRVLLAIPLAACKKRPPPPVADQAPVVAVDAAMVDAAVGIARTPLAGNLAGKPFVVKKAMLRTAPEGATLAFYDWNDGDPCAVQFAPEPDQLYLSMSFRQAAVGPIEAISIYQKPDLAPIKEHTTLVIDELGDDEARGHLRMTAPDGTRVEGAFEATVCAGAQKQLDAPAPIHGLAWGTRGVEPAKLPKQPVTGILLGKPGEPVAVEVIDWKDIAEQHELHFYLAPPKQPCQFTQVQPGFVVGFGATLKAGLAINAASPLVQRGLQPFGVAVWEERGNSIGMAGDGWVTAIIDKHGKDTVEGRVFAWFNDPSKSMIAGAFVAKNCNAKP